MTATIPDPTPTRRSTGPPPTEAVRALEADLRARVEGEVRFDAGTRAIYSTDASNYRQLPIGVVVPRTVDDVVAAVAVAHDHHVPVLSRGGGTSLAGQCCNTAVVIDWSWSSIATAGSLASRRAPCSTTSRTAGWRASRW